MKFLFNLTDMHIHPSSPNSSISEESAATKIQAGFRGYRVRKQLKRSIKKDGGGGGGVGAATAAVANELLKFQRENRGETHKAEKSAATKIQAGVRGYLVRKKQKLAADAAIKIQAGFRGFKARKDCKKSNGKKSNN